MKPIPIGEIRIPANRQRKEFSLPKLKELQQSIEEFSCFHPIVIRHLPLTLEENGGKRGGAWELVAGERRLRVFKMMFEEKTQIKCDNQILPLGMAPCTELMYLDPIERQEAELDENLKRVDLTWQEKTAAQNALMALRRGQDPTTTVTSVAKEISSSTEEPVETVRKVLARAEFIVKHINDVPAALEARDEKEAHKIILRHMEAEFRAALVAQTEQSTAHRLIEGDCISVMSTLELGSYDVVIADPPYGMDADSFGSAGPVHSYDDSPEEATRMAAQIIMHASVLCKPEAHLYIFCDPGFFAQLLSIAASCDWSIWRTPLVWDKGGSHGHNPVPTQAIRRTYEFIFYAYRGDRPGNFMISDVIRDIPQVTGEGHAAAKPGDLYKRLLARSVKPGDRVLDPVCGTGPIFEAANALRCVATGIDKNPDFIKLARPRMFKDATLVEAEGL